MTHFWHELLDMVGDPAHWSFEILTTIVLDGIILGAIWPFLKRRWKREHQDFDRTHDIHHDHDEAYEEFRKNFHRALDEIDKQGPRVIHFPSRDDSEPEVPRTPPRRFSQKPNLKAVPPPQDE